VASTGLANWGFDKLSQLALSSLIQLLSSLSPLLSSLSPPPSSLSLSKGGGFDGHCQLNGTANRGGLLVVGETCQSGVMDAGIPLEAVEFFAELEANNDREWWTAHKMQWQDAVREPMQGLTDQLAAEFGAAKLFRPNRDVRFSLDKSPYKTHQGAVVATGAGIGYYVQVSSGGLLTGAGWYQPAPAQVASYRQAVLAERSGRKLGQVVAALVEAGFEIGGDTLKTAPRGVETDHPRIALLRHRSLLASAEHGTPPWLETAEVVERVRADWRRYRPLMTWLTEHL